MRQLCRPITNASMYNLGSPEDVADGYISSKNLKGWNRIVNADLFVKILNPVMKDLRNTDFANKAIQINDSEFMDDRTREGRLIDLFADNGITLEFYGNYQLKSFAELPH